MNIIAIMHIRNEELYIYHCLKHLVDQGIKVVIIDNESTDKTLEICRSFSPDDVILIDTFPYSGTFDLHALLVRLHEIRRSLDADWIVYQGADEMLESNVRGESLREAIERVDKQGYNIINFDEFVFIPEDWNSNYVGRDYYNLMHHYYFFEPRPNRLMRVFRNDIEMDNIESGGHDFPKKNLKQYPENMVLRHYICLSIEHIRNKYGARVFNKKELEDGWHGNRINIDPEAFRPPPIEKLHTLEDLSGGNFDRSRPLLTHFWQW